MHTKWRCLLLYLSCAIFAFGFTSSLHFFQISVSVDGPEGYEITNDSIKDDPVCIHPGSSESYKLKLKATTLGKINITVRAETAQSSDSCGDSEVSSAFARDAITQSLVVEVRRVES